MSVISVAYSMCLVYRFNFSDTEAICHCRSENFIHLNINIHKI